MAIKQADGRPRLTGFGRFTAGIGIAVLTIWAVYFLATLNFRSLGLPFGEWPRLPLYVYTTSKVTLTFDGEEIAIEGTTRCKRRFEMDEDGDLRPLMFLDHIGFAYYCGPDWFAHRLPDGSALLVGAASDAGPWHSAWRALLPEQPNLAHFDPAFRSEHISRVPPAVVWLDDAEAPTRAEYYYSMAALADPRSRLTAVRHEAEMWAASWWTSFFTRRAERPLLEQVPWKIPGEFSSYFVGHYAIEVPKAGWAAIDGIEAIISEASVPSMLIPRQQLTEAQFQSLSGALASQSGHVPPSRVRPVAVATRRDVSNDSLATGGDSTGAEFRVLPVEIAERAYRIAEGGPVGLIHLYRRGPNSQESTNEFRIGNASVATSGRSLWPSSFVYDPGADAIYRLMTVSF